MKKHKNNTFRFFTRTGTPELKIPDAADLVKFKGMVSRTSRILKRDAETTNNDDPCACTCPECLAGNCCGNEGCRTCGDKGTRAAGDFTKEAFPVVVASENPAIVIDWGQWKIIREILLMQGAKLPDNKQVVLLDRHSCYGAVKDSIKGSCRNLHVEGDQLLGDIYFSSLAADECTLVREGHLTDTSCGYQTEDEGTLVLKPGEAGTIMGRSFTNNYTDGLDLYIRSAWSPKEDSLVPIGADDTSKFRELLLSGEREFNKISIKNNPKEDNMPEVKTHDEIVKEERERVKEIEEYGQRFASKLPKSTELVKQAVREGWDVNVFRMKVLDTIDTSAPIETPGSDVDMTKSQEREYSLTRAIIAHADGSWKDNSLEREVSEEIEKRVGRSLRSDRLQKDP